MLHYIYYKSTPHFIRHTHTTELREKYEMKV